MPFQSYFVKVLTYRLSENYASYFSFSTFDINDANNTTFQSVYFLQAYSEISYKRTAKMKLSYSFMFFVVLIYGTLCCFEVTADNDSDDTAKANSIACTLQNLKTTGTLSDDFPLNTNPTSCDKARTMTSIYEDILWNLAHLMDMEMPDKKKCVITEFETKDKILDRYLAIPTIAMADFLTETEKGTHISSLRNEFRQQLEDIAAKCGAETVKFLSYFNRHFDDKANF